MLHRYLAAGLGLLIVRSRPAPGANRRDPAQPTRLPLVLVLLVVFQGLLGMWTVTLLKPLFVVAHLIGGLTTTALCALALPAGATYAQRLQPGCGAGWWQLTMPRCRSRSAAGSARTTRHWPVRISQPARRRSGRKMDFQDAFVLWRGLGIDYEGGVLDHPRASRFYFTHRIGAMALRSRRIRRRARCVGRAPVRALASCSRGAPRQLVLGPARCSRACRSRSPPRTMASRRSLLATVALLRAVTRRQSGTEGGRIAA